MILPQLRIIWNDGSEVAVDLEHNPASEYYVACLRHLRHLDLCFGPRENPFHGHRETVQSLSARLKNLLDGYDINIDLLRLQDQAYLNILHDIYFKRYKETSSDTNWLEIHDLIHLLEDKIPDRAHRHESDRPDIWFDFKARAGLLMRPFNPEWYSFATTAVERGQCYIRSHELGKTPITYYRDREPDDIEHFCELGKPWVKLKPIMDIAIGDFDYYQRCLDSDHDAFMTWFSKYKDAWCRHWGIDHHEVKYTFSVLPIGRVSDIDLLEQKFKDLDYPTRLSF